MFKHLSLICLLVVQFSFIHTETNTTVADKCNLKSSSEREQKLLQKLNDLQISKQFRVVDDEHSYSIGICTKAADAKELDVGLIQTNVKTNQTFVIGRLDDVDLDGSDMYLRVVYKNGDNYNNACNKAQRTAVIAIVCNYYNDSEIFSLLEENTDRKTDSCAYYFQLQTPKMCAVPPKSCQPTSNNTTKAADPSPSASTTTTTTAATTNSASTATTPSNPATTATSTQASTNQSTKSSSIPSTTALNANQTTTSAKSQTGSRLGFFSISAIVLTSVLFCYFVIGTLYNRFVNQTRGIEQLPHWQFWHSLGIKFQECSYLICKCRKKQSDIRAYDHINDQLSDDENLLNM